MYPSILAFIFLLLISFLSFIHLRRQKNGRKLPTGPPALPVVGNLHMLGHLPHRTLQDLSKKYGPIMSLKLGSMPAIVVSSPQAAELFLKTHDIVFASRPKVQASDYLSYGSKGMAFSEYGPYWRDVRKFCALELLSVAKIDLFAEMRRAEVGALVASLRAVGAAREAVDLSEKVAGVVEDMTCTMLFGRKNYEGFDLKGVVHEILTLVGAFNLADFMPFLAPLDIQGLTRRLKSTSKTMDKMLERIIDEHEQDANNWSNQRNHKDFIDAMLSLMNNPSPTYDKLSHSIDRTNIKAILLDMIVGAVDTSATAIEWTLSELLRNPRVMTKLQDELQRIVGGNRIVEESDLEKSEYLDMVIKESSRLHPVAPLLVPRESRQDISIDGYFIPKKSRIMMNYWAIGRDPEVWSENVEEFLPERFVGAGDVDLRGFDFKLLPFGSGCRRCPGMHSGLTNVRLVVAQLVHCFDWELPDGMSPDELAMREKFGLYSRHEQVLALSRSDIEETQQCSYKMLDRKKERLNHQ